VASLVMIDDTNVEITRMLHLLFEAEDVRVSVTMDDAEGIRKAQGPTITMAAGAPISCSI
jgi:hypothetical protein